MNSSLPSPSPAHRSMFQLSLDWRLLSLVLLGIILVMLWWWQPWQKTSTKTVTVRGESTVEHAPDEYQFQPLYQDADTKAVTATGNDVVARLKQLGVKDADIKTSVSSAAGKTAPQELSPMPPNRGSSVSIYSITFTVRDKALAQTVADYLATTSTTGQVTPQASFSKSVRSRLDLEARSKASDDAKAKANVMAKQLGAKVGKVVKISEDNNYGIYTPEGRAGVSADSSRSSASAGPTIQPGVNQFTYVLTVEFELK